MNLILNIVGWIALAAIALTGTWMLVTGLMAGRKAKSFLGLIGVVVALGLTTLGWQYEGSVLQASFGLGVLVTFIVGYFAILIALAAIKKQKASPSKSTTEPVTPVTKPSPTPPTSGQAITRPH